MGNQAGVELCRQDRPGFVETALVTGPDAPLQFEIGEAGLSDRDVFMVIAERLPVYRKRHVHQVPRPCHVAMAGMEIAQITGTDASVGMARPQDMKGVAVGRFEQLPRLVHARGGRIHGEERHRQIIAAGRGVGIVVAEMTASLLVRSAQVAQGVLRASRRMVRLAKVVDRGEQVRMALR